MTTAELAELEPLRALLRLVIDGCRPDDWWDYVTAHHITTETRPVLFAGFVNAERVSLTAYGQLVARALGCVRQEGRCECPGCSSGWVYLLAPRRWKNLYDKTTWGTATGRPLGCARCFARLDPDGWATLSPLYHAEEDHDD